MSTILVTGGAGYIGSHTVRHLMEQGHEVVVLDNLRTGHRAAVLTPHFYVGDISDAALIAEIVHKHKVVAAVHFAALSLVGESMKLPTKYLEGNTIKSQQFIQALVENGVRRIVFSSTAAVYGMPAVVPISERSPTLPINPYGISKLFIEQYLQMAQTLYGLKWIALRYFNAAGAAQDGRIGEAHDPETHLIPLVLQTALGQRNSISVFGQDYDTPDGTAVRDYIHVEDLADAHARALQALADGKASGAYNVGTGRGYSVLEVIEAARRITGRPIPLTNAPRREGDPAVLVAQVDRIRTELGFVAQHSDLESMIASAWKWHQHHPEGYEE
ncbi:UDP-glucose 4-epimerase GalE [Tumebacillus permanentifrigoris]|uniref:UDP-glucose 4-epimerase n=1 Tax=Tumebacillus permanentifrigoris TaxID=378543 RepID=A0A316DB56_9BACL|nr:UDP-glucose 4-epimerase GalE [Tumebacillus permanentifrigoris]PWK11254.1 UDP-galactose 4-epimerase [Tumebacillus permanentifrigoris]